MVSLASLRSAALNHRLLSDKPPAFSTLAHIPVVSLALNHRLLSDKPPAGFTGPQSRDGKGVRRRELPGLERPACKVPLLTVHLERPLAATSEVSAEVSVKEAA